MGHAIQDWKSEELLAWLFNESPCKDEVVVNDRWGKECRHKHGGYWTTEYARWPPRRLPSVGGKPRHGIFLRSEPGRTLDDYKSGARVHPGAD